MMDAGQRPVILPALKVTVQRTPGRKILRDIAPLATGAQYIHEAVDHFPDIDLPAAPAVFGRRNLWLNVRPFLVSQVTRVAKLVPVVPGAVLWSPHAAPRESVAAIESRESRPHKPPSLTDSNDSHTSGTDTQTRWIQGERRT